MEPQLFTDLLINTFNMQTHYIAILETKMHEMERELETLRPLIKTVRYWSDEEHERFLKATEIYGSHRAKEIAIYVGTKTSMQVRSHAQKYYKRLGKRAQ